MSNRLYATRSLLTIRRSVPIGVYAHADQLPSGLTNLDMGLEVIEELRSGVPTNMGALTLEASSFGVTAGVRYRDRYSSGEMGAAALCTAVLLEANGIKVKFRVDDTDPRSTRTLVHFDTGAQPVDVRSWDCGTLEVAPAQLAGAGMVAALDVIHRCGRPDFLSVNGSEPMSFRDWQTLSVLTSVTIP